MTSLFCKVTRLSFIICICCVHNCWIQFSFNPLFLYSADWFVPGHYSNVKKIIVIYLYFRFTIKNLYGEKFYLISLNASVNFDAKSEEEYTIIMENSLLPKTVCDWSSDFYISSMFTSFFLWSHILKSQLYKTATLLYKKSHPENISYSITISKRKIDIQKEKNNTKLK